MPSRKACAHVALTSRLRQKQERCENQIFGFSCTLDGIVYGMADMSIGIVINAALLIAEILDADEMGSHVEFL